MDYYKLEPEAPGVLTGKSRVDRSSRPAKVSNLKILLEDWEGDHLLWTFPVFIVTKQLKLEITTRRLTGCTFQDFAYVFGAQAPAKMRSTKFSQMVVGQFSEGVDFYLDSEEFLVVSAAALTVLQQFGIGGCRITALAA